MFKHLKNVFVRIFTIKGRAPRAEFWYFTLVVYFLFPLFLTPFVFTTFFLSNIEYIYYISWILFIPVTIISTTLIIRRLHDLGKSGWNFLFILIPLIGSVFLLYFTLKGGEKGDNKYGKDPYGSIIIESKNRKNDKFNKGKNESDLKSEKIVGEFILNGFVKDENKIYYTIFELFIAFILIFSIFNIIFF